ncbi:flagellar hook-length control protein FliK [Planomicrobium sp. CPCC 101079]|uniref:flagellar hook-length control protein FliK n=1 Tax=Planomicrobium sp. CPCC 101079 TaxID=2599618 RepID=UPI0011B3CBD2|nr:flagellar hook-length control protein FliK [Planomicrobium sp. CPCC 101079]TWT03696.1 hypothetical protein FQV28_11800 [Planomicrobium sp. CPCC 101079]
MNAMPISLSAPLKSIKATESKPAAPTAKSDSVDFAQLLGAVSAAPTENQSATDGQEELLEKLDSLLGSLEQLPKEDLTPEQQEMLQAIMGLLAQQVSPPKEQMELAIEANPLEQSPTIQQPVQKELMLTAQALEKLQSSTLDQAKLTGLLEEAVEVLQKLTDASVKETGTTSLPADVEKLEQVVSQLTGLIKELNNDQQKADTKTKAAQVEQVEQVLKQVTGLKQEPINLTQPKEIQTPPAMPAVENAAEVQAAPEETASKPLETAPKQPELGAPAAPAEQSQPAAAGTEAAKATAVPQKPEAIVPQATVRLSNLVEDLGETLKGSFRLNGEGDSKQIKISIFPEHLGHMEIKLTSIDGKIVAQIFTSTLAAKEALDQQASLLRSSMMQQGISVEKIEISQQSSQQSFGQQSANRDQRFSQQQKQGAYARNRNGYQQLEEDAAVITRRQSNDGSMMKVDYTI